MSRTRTIGLLIWRSGLLLAGSYSLFRAARLGLRFVDLPAELEVGLGLALGGAGLVFVSLIMERARDVREEGDLAS